MWEQGICLNLWKNIPSEVFSFLLGTFLKTEKGTTAIYITTAKYFTPKGECIHKIGISPDVVVEMPEEYKFSNFDDLTIDQDTQLKMAWENLIK